jgi:hypothetical protein
MTMSPEAESCSLSDPLTVPELERIYHEVALKQNFYGDSYGSERTFEPYEEMAKMLGDVIAPTKHVGCCKGCLVLAMRRLGIASFGVDFSEALVRFLLSLVDGVFLVQWLDSLLDLESRAAQDFRPILMKYNWNPYILQILPRNHLQIAIGLSNCLGTSWHEREELGRQCPLDERPCSDLPKLRQAQDEITAP